MDTHQDKLYTMKSTGSPSGHGRGVQEMKKKNDFTWKSKDKSSEMVSAHKDAN